MLSVDPRGRYSNRSHLSEKPGLLELLLSCQKELKVFAAYVRNEEPLDEEPASSNLAR